MLDLQRVREVCAAQAQLELAVLFGSTARQQDGPSSDLDVAVLGLPGLDQAELARTLSLVAHREVDVVDLACAPWPVLEAVLRDGVLLFERRPGRFGRFQYETVSTLELDRPAWHRMRDAFLEQVAARTPHG